MDYLNKMKRNIQYVSEKVNSDLSNHSQLFKIASLCAIFQFWAAILYLFFCLLFPQSHTFALLSGVLAIIISITPAVFAIEKKNFLLVFSCISAFNLAPIWFLYLEAVLPGHDAYDYILPHDRLEALFWIAMFQFFGNIFYMLFWRRINTFSVNSFSFLKTVNFKPDLYIKLTILTFILPIIAFYFYYGSAEILWTAVTAGRSGGGSAGGLLMQEATGNSSSLMIPFNSIWQLTPLFGVIAFSSSNTKYTIMPTLSLMLGVLVIFVFFLGGSRGIMMFVAAPVLFFLFYFNWDRGLKFWIAAMILAFLTIGIMELQVRFRGNLLEVLIDPDKAAQEYGYKSVTTFDPSESHRDNNMYLFCLMVKSFPDKYPFEGYHDYFTMLVNPIPRFVWPDKPVLIGAKDLSQQSQFVLDGPLFMGTTSLTFSVVGEAYQAGGVGGILVYAFTYALFFLFFDGIISYITNKQPLPVGILGVGVFLSFWGYRGLFALISFLYPILILIVTLHLIHTFRRNANHIYST